MPTTISNLATGISPDFPVTAEELKLSLVQGITRVDIDGVPPPSLGEQAGYSNAHDIVNKWFPWIDEKIVEPKYDGVCQFLGTPSNRPSLVKDFHLLALYRAVDYVLAPAYVGRIQAGVGTILPVSPPA